MTGHANPSLAGQPRPLDETALPRSLLQRPKRATQVLADFLFFPLRVLIPDPLSERVGLSSLRCERMAVVLQEMRGRCLDIGAHDNLLLRHYADRHQNSDSLSSIGLDVIDWNGQCLVLPHSASLPFADASFDSVCFVACLNHIPERREALAEARRVLKPNGRLMITMISRLVGYLDHRLRWWGEHSERDTHEDELDGMDKLEILSLLDETGFVLERRVSFFYGMNSLFIASQR